MTTMIKDINIHAVLNGFVVTVGCQTVVFGSRKELLRELEGYLTAPAEMEKTYREGALHKDLLACPVAPPSAGLLDTCAAEAPQCAERALLQNRRR